MLQCAAVFCSVCFVLQCVLCRSAWPCVAVRCSALQCVAACCSALQCAAVHCSVCCLSMYACEPAYHTEGCRIEWAAKKKGGGGQLDRRG